MNATSADEQRRTLILAIADDELVTGHRHSHWTGVAPSLEEDLAFSSIAQDELGHAGLWYSLLVADSPTDPSTPAETVDRLALGRPTDGYRHAVLCERPPRDFGYTLARHWLYDHADAVRLDVLAGSRDPDVAAVAVKLRHEERYHLEHADHWFRRLARGGEATHARLGDGLAAAFEEALWLFEPLPGEAEMTADGLLPAGSTAQLTRWLEAVLPAIDAAELGEVLPTALLAGEDGWGVADDHFATPGGRRGRHSPDFTDDVWPEMTGLYRAHPGARW